MNDYISHHDFLLQYFSIIFATFSVRYIRSRFVCIRFNAVDATVRSADEEGVRLISCFVREYEVTKPKKPSWSQGESTLRDLKNLLKSEKILWIQTRRSTSSETSKVLTAHYNRDWTWVCSSLRSIRFLTIADQQNYYLSLPPLSRHSRLSLVLLKKSSYAILVTLALSSKHWVMTKYSMRMARKLKLLDLISFEKSKMDFGIAANVRIGWAFSCSHHHIFTHYRNKKQVSYQLIPPISTL